MDVAKRLAFEDLSLTLNQLVNADESADLKSQLLSLLGECEGHSRQLEERSSSARDQASKTLQHLGGRTLLKRQLQSLKSSLQNLGQKASFSDALLSFSEDHDYRAEAERTAAALESAEEDLKDLKKANHQDEGDLCEAIRVVESRREALQAYLARLDQKLEGAASELASLGMSKLPVQELSLPDDVDEAGLDQAVADEQQQALRLEGELAKAEAGCLDLEADLSAHDAEMARMQAEIARLKSLRHDEARAVDARHTAAIQWCDAMAASAAALTGVRLEHITEDELCVTLSGGGGGVRTLTAQLRPGGAELHNAKVSPAPAGGPSTDALVEFARESGGGLPLLLTLLRASEQQRRSGCGC